MEKKFEDDELDKLLEEQFMKEADMIEEALFSDKNFEDFEETDEEVRAAYNKLVKRLKADGIYREEANDRAENNDSAEKESSSASDSDEVAAEIGDRTETISAQSTGVQEHGSKVIPMRGAEERGEEPKGKKRYKIVKAAGFVVVATMCVFAASMTSEANRNYFINKVRYLAGDDTRIVGSNDEKNDRSMANETEARNRIKDELGVKIPNFTYRPDTFEFYTYEMDSSSEFALMEYKYYSTIISMHLSRKDLSSESNMFSLHGRQITTINLQEDDVNVKIFELQDTQDVESSFAAHWNMDGVYYQISGKMKKDEFIKLVEKMKY
ncbi:DUF4367 domain-containing protein [Blautia schinkii]|nr:DUF4367 domain-containing protein [Blautia schinkii]